MLLSILELKRFVSKFGIALNNAEAPLAGNENLIFFVAETYIKQLF
jgi:hypothetical protein